MPFWPEYRAERADRLGYVRTSNCRVGQLLHMREVILDSVETRRQARRIYLRRRLVEPARAVAALLKRR